MCSPPDPAVQKQIFENYVNWEGAASKTSSAMTKKNGVWKRWKSKVLKRRLPHEVEKGTPKLTKNLSEKKAKKEEKDPDLKKKSPKAAAAKKKTVPKEAAASSSCLTPATPKASLSKNLLLKENKDQTVKRVRQELEVCMKEGKQEDPEKEAARQRQIKAKKVTRLF